jgi:hypothetical protein
VNGPPERERAAPHHQDDPNQNPNSDHAPDSPSLADIGAKTPYDVPGGNARRFTASRRIGRGRGYAVAWREGFSYGFRDARRLVARQVDDSRVWAALAEIADGCALAGHDE